MKSIPASTHGPGSTPGIANTRQVLAACQPPLSFAGPPPFSAYDVFAGYLVFDAWISNQDRHEANWSILHSPDGERYLAPSYDHAASLGSGLDDEHLSRRWTIPG